MPWGLTRFHHSGQSHFVTFCCYHRHRLFTADASCRIFESALERVRRSFSLHVYGYVVMPEHVHLLPSEPQWDTSSGRTAPLKPKDGLNGPPVLGEPQQDTSSDRTAPLKPRDGLNGPPVLGEPQQDTSSDRTAPLKPRDGLNGPPALSYFRLLLKQARVILPR